MQPFDLLPCVPGSAAFNPARSWTRKEREPKNWQVSKWVGPLNKTQNLGPIEFEPSKNRLGLNNKIFWNYFCNELFHCRTESDWIKNSLTTLDTQCVWVDFFFFCVSSYIRLYLRTTSSLLTGTVFNLIRRFCRVRYGCCRFYHRNLFVGLLVSVVAVRFVHYSKSFGGNRAQKMTAEANTAMAVRSLVAV